MRVATTRGLAVAIGLLVAALLVDAAATIYNVREIATNVEWVSHTHEVLAKLEAALSSLKDAETGQRGYLLTGDAGLSRAVPRGGEPIPGPAEPSSGSSPSTTPPRPRACCGSSSSRASGWPSSGAPSTSSRPSPIERARSRPPGSRG